MGSINTYTLKQYKECYSDLLERHKLEYEDHNEFTFINSELESFWDGLIYIEDIDELPFQFQFLKSFTDEELSNALADQKEFRDSAIKSNLSSSMIIDFLEQRKQDLERESNLKAPGQFQFENKFDKVKEDNVIQYFVEKLVDKKLMTRENLDSYLKQAFELKTLPEKKISFTNNPTKDKIRKIFYDYYVLAGTPYGKQTQYLQLLTNYFTGFEKMSPKNFSR